MDSGVSIGRLRENDALSFMVSVTGCEKGVCVCVCVCLCACMCVCVYSCVFCVGLACNQWQRGGEMFTMVKQMQTLTVMCALILFS